MDCHRSAQRVSSSQGLRLQLVDELVPQLRLDQGGEKRDEQSRRVDTELKCDLTTTYFESVEHSFVFKSLVEPFPELIGG